MNDLSKEFLYSSSRLKRLLMSQFHEAMQATDLPPAQAEIIYYIIKIDDTEDVQANAIGRAMHLSPGAISQLLDGLEDRGCITRQRSTTDRRQLLIKLQTDHPAVKHLQAYSKQLHSEITTALGPDLLAKMIEAQHTLIEYFSNKQGDPDGKN